MSERPHSPRVRYRVDERGIAYVVLDDHATRNALTNLLLDELTAWLESARSDPGVRVVVLTSRHNKVFSSGGDLKAFTEAGPAVSKYHAVARFPRLFTLIGSLGKPVLCAANGDILAGALGLALACDMIIAKKSARFGCPEINVGIFPFMVSALMYRSIGRLKANELMMLGELLSANEAAALGLVNKVVPDDEFDDEIDRLAGTLASKSPLLMRLGKDALNSTRDMSLPEAFDVLQAQLALAFTTEDIIEGVTAFQEKRSPQWRYR